VIYAIIEEHGVYFGAAKVRKLGKNSLIHLEDTKTKHEVQNDYE
jgi:hypothetical protein